MAEFDIKAASPDTSLPSTGFLFGADSQASANPSIYSVATTITALLGNAASADLLSFNSDAIFGRRAAANLRLGAADAAAPVAQTLSVQSVVAGTTNTIGQEFRIDGSQGTGTGAGGSIVFRVAPAGSSGSAVNALSTALTIDSTRRATFTGDELYVGGSTHFFRDLTTSAPKFSNGSANAVILLGSTAGGSQKGLWVTSNSTEGIGFLSGNYNNAADVILTRDAANTLALKNSTAAQEFRVYETTTGPIYKALLGNRQLMKISGAAFDNGAGASTGTLTNSPAVGNPTKWIPIDDNGTTRYIPAW